MKRNIIIFDDTEVRRHLLPLSYTRPVAHLRVGITTIDEKWRSMLVEATYSYLTVEEGAVVILNGHGSTNTTLHKHTLC